MVVGIIGAGAMGSGIAQVAATAGCQVLVFDIDREALDLSRQKLQKIMTRLVQKERINESESARIQNTISYTNSTADLQNSELIIEAIVENLEIKKQTFSAIEKIVSKQCILATNTSSLAITALGGNLQDPTRFIGIHFFNPAPLMKLVEVIPALQTDPLLANQVISLIKSWQKEVVLAKDTPGFIVNKIARPFYSEALRILDEGIADVFTIDRAVTSMGGFRMGPFTLMDYIGNDVNYKVTESVWKSFYYDDRYKPSLSQKQLVDAGYFGKKSGRGFYDYSNPPDWSLSIDETLGAIIVDRIVIMLINEAADTLHLNIANRDDIETAMTKGVNYPRGLLHWADEIGIDQCVKKMDALFDEYHEPRYRCSPLLRKMAKEHIKFYI